MKMSWHKADFRISSPSLEGSISHLKILFAIIFVNPSSVLNNKSIIADLRRQGIMRVTIMPISI